MTILHSLSDFELERAVKGAGFEVTLLGDSWVVFDPRDNSDGFRLELDSKREVLAETFEHFELARPAY